MVTTQMAPSLGCGIYRIADVARYARIPVSTIYDWFRTRSVLESDFIRIDDMRAVSFHDLIDTFVAHHFRKFGVTLRTVRRAYRNLIGVLGTPHPFCHRGLYTDGKRIIVDVSKALGESTLQDAVKDQRFFDFIKKHLDHVSYSELNNLATRWLIHTNVMIDPQIAFGSPVIQGTRVNTHIVHGTYYANNKDAALVSRLYRISTGQVKDAVTFEDSIRTAA
jgi:uncharacterized protein (DUF433 family)